MLPFRNKGFSLIELMVAMAIGALLVLAAMILYVPVSRSLVDQGIIGQQTLSESFNYDFDIMNSANAGYGVATPQVNTDVMLVTGTGPGSNAVVPIPTTSGSAQGNGFFWDWATPVGSPVSCGGLQIVASANTQNGHQRLVYYQEVPTGGCTAAAMNSATNWNTVTLMPSVAIGATPPITVTAAQNCDLRGSQFAGNPIQHPLVSILLPIHSTLTGGFFAHMADQVPVTVCLHNLP